MKKTVLGKTGLEVSVVAYGGIVSAAHYQDLHNDRDGQLLSDRYVEWALEHGINYFDVAPSYGDAQLMIGNSLIPHRDKINLACKTRERMRKGAETEMRESLKLLHTDHFEVYQLHAVTTAEDVRQIFSKGGVAELLDEMKRNGTALNVGITAHSEMAALKALEQYDFDAVMFPINWHMHMEHDRGSRLVKLCKERNIGLICIKSMAERGWHWESHEDDELRRQNPKSWLKTISTQEPELCKAAMKYSLSWGADMLIPPGDFEHFKLAVEAIDEVTAEPLTDEDMSLLRARLDEVRDMPFFRLDEL